jgi:hypothetical protein
MFPAEMLKDFWAGLRAHRPIGDGQHIRIGDASLSLLNMRAGNGALLEYQENDHASHYPCTVDR